MKTIFTLLIIIGLSFSAFAKHSNPFGKKQTSKDRVELNQLKNGYLGFSPSAITVDSWDSEDWTFEYTTTFVYDANGNVSESINSIWMDDEWVTVGGNRTVREYDSEGEVISEIYSMFQLGFGWSEYGGHKIERTYTGLLLTQEIEYIRENGAWVADVKTEFFYDSNNKPNMAREYEYEGNVFVLKGRYTDVSWYLWNGNVNEGSYLLGYIYQKYNGSGDINNGANYTDDEKMVATYEGTPVNGVPPIMTQTDYLWMNGAWVITDYQQTHITPTLVYHIEHSYVGGMLMRVDKSTQMFDTHKNITEAKQEWHNGDENWVQDGGTKFEITYEGATAKILQRITMEWDQNTGAYVNVIRETYEYAPTSVKTEKVGVSVYPTIISSQINIVTQQEGIVAFYSLTGSVVIQKQVYAGTNNVSTSSLPAGYYILKVNGNTFKVIKK